MRPLSRFLIRLASLVLPTGIALAAPFAYIPNLNSRDVSVMDTATNLVVATVQLNESCSAVAVNASETRVYLLCGGRRINHRHGFHYRCYTKEVSQ
jgi:YVTN family beta-propeller protein